MEEIKISKKTEKLINSIAWAIFLFGELFFLIKFLIGGDINIGIWAIIFILLTGFNELKHLQLDRKSL